MWPVKWRGRMIRKNNKLYIKDRVKKLMFFQGPECLLKENVF